jgi:hypothetical protein
MALAFRTHNPPIQETKPWLIAKPLHVEAF